MAHVDDASGVAPPAGLTCPHRPPCPGCPRFGEPGIAPGARASLDRVANAHGLPAVEVISGSMVAFRHRSRMAIRGRVGSPKLGLFELGSHRVVHIPGCRVHHPLINRVAGVVRRALVDARVTSYSDKAHLGLARHLQVVVERRTQTAQVVIVANSPAPDALAGCFELIRERLGPELHSLWFNANSDRTNTILGSEFHLWCGKSSVSERFGGPAIHYPPGAFGQNNLEIADRIIGHVRSQIPPGARVAEFYAGVGAIGLSVLDRVREIRLNELSPQSLHGLGLGIAELGPIDRARISVVPGGAGRAGSAAVGVDVIIADPPRKGLDSGLIEHLVDQPPERFIYVSCSLASFIGDVARLCGRGTLRLTGLAAFNLMPFTEHVETVACFERP